MGQHALYRNSYDIIITKYLLKPVTVRSLLIMMGIVIGVFVITYGMYLHCSFLILFDTTGMASCNDVKYKFPVLVLNSAINPLAYAFFKRDVSLQICF